MRGKRLTKVKYPVSLNKGFAGIEYVDEVILLHKQAKDYLLGFHWCAEVNESFLYTNLGRVFCIFLFDIVNTASESNNFLWVIAGDIPFMYLNITDEDTIHEVIRNYIDLAVDWIDHIKKGLSIDECYPFIAEPSLEMADLLLKRVSFISDTLIDNIDDIKVELC